MKTVYIIDAVRTPIGRYGGALSTVRPDDLLAHVIKALIQRNATIDVNAIEDVIAGDANQAVKITGMWHEWLHCLQDLPVTVAGNTVNRLCASGLQAIMDASRAIMCGDGELFIAGGVESMTRAPFVMAKQKVHLAGKHEIYDTTMGWRFPNKKLLICIIPIPWERLQKMLQSNGEYRGMHRMNLHLKASKNILQHWMQVNGKMKLFR